MPYPQAYATAQPCPKFESLQFGKGTVVEKWYAVVTLIMHKVAKLQYSQVL